MDHLHYAFDASHGDVIEVTLDRMANVQLLTPEEYENYTHGRGYHYFGGYAKKSPVRLTVPQAGTWHVVIDLGGGAGQVRASARLVAGAVA